MPRLAPVLAIALLSSACASQGGLIPGTPTAGDWKNTVALTVVHDPSTRPPLLRLAQAEYTIDGKRILDLQAQPRADVPDTAAWIGAVRPGSHVIEARLRYPIRGDASLDGVEFTVVETWKFSSSGEGPVRIRVEEACNPLLSTTSMDKRLGVRFSSF